MNLVKTRRDKIASSGHRHNIYTSCSAVMLQTKSLWSCCFHQLAPCATKTTRSICSLDVALLKCVCSRKAITQHKNLHVLLQGTICLPWLISLALSHCTLAYMQVCSQWHNREWGKAPSRAKNESRAEWKKTKKTVKNDAQLEREGGRRHRTPLGANGLWCFSVPQTLITPSKDGKKKYLRLCLKRNYICQRYRCPFPINCRPLNVELERFLPFRVSLLNAD